MNRRLSALLLAAAVLGPLTPASAEDPGSPNGGWMCSFYLWDAQAEVWWRVATFVDEATYESTHVRDRDYHCKRNCVPAILPPDPTGGGGGAHVAPVTEPLAGVAGKTVWVGPACPPGNLPPEPAYDPSITPGGS